MTIVVSQKRYILRFTTMGAEIKIYNINNQTNERTFGAIKKEREQIFRNAKNELRSVNRKAHSKFHHQELFG